MSYRTIVGTAVGAVAALLVGCGASAPSNELVTARQTLDEARKGQAAQYRPDEIHRAEKTLALAEGVYEEEPGSALEQDLAYIADRQARLAMTNARRDALAGRQEQAENQYRRQLEATNRARQERQRELDQRLSAVGSDLERVRGELTAREVELGTQSEELRQREQALIEQQQALVEQQQVLEQERLARAQAEMAAVAALEELAQVRQEQDRMVITLNGSVLFATAQTDLLPSARRRLEAVAAVLKQNPDRQIVIEGHTDTRGTDAYNEQLSQSRARAVREFLVDQGVPSESLRAVGRGEAEPVATNATTEGRANNRRVEIIIEEAQAK